MRDVCGLGRFPRLIPRLIRRGAHGSPRPPPQLLPPTPAGGPAVSVKATDEFLRAIPKTDLHVHLDGSLRLSTLIELAACEGGACVRVRARVSVCSAAGVSLLRGWGPGRAA